MPIKKTKTKIAKIEETPVVEAPIVEAKKTSEPIIFQLKNGIQRVFSYEVHGPNYKEIAKNFSATNAGHIIT